MARAVPDKPEVPGRTTERVDLEPLSALHGRLNKVSVKLDPNPDPDELRRLFSTIRRNRNLVARILGTFLPRVARCKADLLRVDASIAAETAVILYTQNGMALTKNEKQRAARIRVLLEDHYGLQEELKEDLMALEAVVAHARQVLEELRYSFEEASRSFTTIELEYKMQIGRAEG